MTQDGGSEHRIDFLAVGPQRTGSTWLYEKLLHHPEIAWPQGVKETFFFDSRFNNGFNWYYKHFSINDSSVVGEAGPTYFDDPLAPDRIFEHAPQCKIIINIRNPISKTYSVFRHYYTSGLVPIDFDKAIEKAPRILDSGHYEKHSMRWESLFGNERIMYLVQDDVIADPQGCIQSVCQFLEIDMIESGLGNSEKVNTASAPRSPQLVFAMESVAKFLRFFHLHSIVNFGKQIGLKKLYQGGVVPQPLTPKQHARLLELFEPDIHWIESHLSRQFPAWREFNTQSSSNH